MSMVCNKIKEDLDSLFDQIVDTSLSGQDAANLSLPAICQAHLSHCQNCRDYHSTNLMFFEAASTLPVLEVPRPEALTNSIMQSIMGGEHAPQAVASSAKIYGLDAKYDIWILIGSFVAFGAMSAYGSSLDDSFCNITSWLISLLLLLALKPIIEKAADKEEVVSA